MKLKLYIILTISLLFAGCIKEWGEVATDKGPVTVGFFAGGGPTRTTINSDGVSTSWSKDDKVALWAINSEGTATLSAQPFKIYYRDGQKALFTATLTAPMAAGSYNYYATYPVPKSVSGTQASFTLPASQDGQISKGAAIMIATPATGSQLGIVTGEPGADDAYEIDDNHLSLRMKHTMHALRFFVMQNQWGFAEGETIERIVFTMPQTVAGDVTLDYTNPSSAPAVTNGVNTMSLDLARNIGATTSAANPDFAAASIIPTAAFNDGDELKMKVYSQKQLVEQTILLAGREAMLAGHITPVAIDCSSPRDLPKMSFRITTNNLGEQPYRITLTSSDSSTKWKENDDHIYEYYTGSESSTIATGNGFDIYYDESTISSISGKSVTVTYESKSAIVTNSITMPSMTAGNDYTINLTVPYLFFEDFSTINTYGFDVVTNAQGTAVTGYDLSIANSDKDNVNPGLRSGWTGARTGGSAGSAIRVGSRVDQVYGFTHTFGRLDSPALSGLKNGANVKISVSFNYSGGRDGRSEFSPRAVFGYTTTSGPIDGTTGSFSSDSDNWKDINGYTLIPSISTSGSFTNITQSMTHTISNCNNTYRLSWQIRGTGKITGFIQVGNGNQWMFIDNIKVQIVQ
ncbi:MAG: hypothetical protein IKM03_06120 [Alistipes sp.]|nr:hypothetical protein [Alistipes sp.]